MNRKLRVLQLGSSSGLYGAERWILSLVKYLDKSKIESHVGSISDRPNIESPLCTEARKLEVPVHTINGNGKFSISSINNLRECIKEYQIDILHTHGYKTDLIGLLATRGTECKIVSTPHGWTKNPGLRLWIYEVLDRISFPFFDVVAPLSEGLFKPLQRIPGLKKKLHLIKNGVDINEIEDLSDRSNEIEELKKNGAYILGYIGRLTPGKGLDVLFDAVSKYAQPNWQVALIGEGEQFEELKSLADDLSISDRVHFYGFRPDRLAFLKSFDAFVLPSRSEGIPRCLMEAMSAEVPVIASDIPGCRNLIDGKTTGLLFPMDSSEALAKSIQNLEDDELKEKIIRGGKAFVSNNYSAERMANEYETLFLSMCHAS